MQQTVSFRHLLRMTDDVGLLEHAHGLIPRRQEGYTVDDNARALWAVLWWIEKMPNSPLRKRLLQLVDTYLGFLFWTQEESGLFHNNVAYDRSWEEETPSDDCLGRALWALAWAAARAPGQSRRKLANEMFWKAWPHVQDTLSLRGSAYALSAASFYLQSPYTMKNEEMKGHLKNDIASISQELLRCFYESSTSGWSWFEPQMTYSNGILPWGLLMAYDVLASPEVKETALCGLDFLISKMEDPLAQYIQPVGNQGWCTLEQRSQWDQQPIDVMKLALACREAYRLTQGPPYRDKVQKCQEWFAGRNQLGVMMSLPEEGAGYDGLHPFGANFNAGAESTLSYLLTERIFVDVREQASVRFQWETKDDELRLIVLESSLATGA